jgi:hypothetical protein
MFHAQTSFSSKHEPKYRNRITASGAVQKMGNGNGGIKKQTHTLILLPSKKYVQ